MPLTVPDAHPLLLFEGYRNEKVPDKQRASAHFNTLAVNQTVPVLENREEIIVHELWPAETVTFTGR
jgi:hypothetical protein